MNWNTETRLQIWNWSGRCRCKDAKNNKYVLNTLTGLLRLVATGAQAGQNLLSGTRLYSQQCHPSPRGRRGARLCPLVFAPLSASEGELTCRIAEPSSPAAHSPSLPPSFSHSSCQESQTHLGSRPRCLSPPARSGRDKCCQGFTKMATFLGAPQAQPGPSITGRPYKHVASLRHHYSHITQRRISAAETGHQLWKLNEEWRHLRLRAFENINLCDVNSFWCVI